uniref:Uncharacterized protein n=1 Tax=Rhizophora mucronata TaxID=61149 RepID=A0A2P2MKG2_RHIMU
MFTVSSFFSSSVVLLLQAPSVTPV